MYLSGKHSLLLLLPEGTPVNIFCHSTFLPVTCSSFLMELQDKQKLMPSVLFLSRLGIHPKSLSLWPVLTVCLSWASLSFLRGLPPQLHVQNQVSLFGNCSLPQPFTYCQDWLLFSQMEWNYALSFRFRQAVRMSYHQRLWLGYEWPSKLLPKSAGQH